MPHPLLTPLASGLNDRNQVYINQYGPDYDRSTPGFWRSLNEANLRHTVLALFVLMVIAVKSGPLQALEKIKQFPPKA